jgi:hypothetical protein
VTIYDVLRRLVQRANLAEQEQADALAAIDEAQQWAALGTTTGRLTAQAHACIPTYPNGIAEPPVCGLCHQLMEA